MIYQWNHEAANAILGGLLEIYNIKRHSHFMKGAGGRAYIADRKISIPSKLDTPYRFMVCLHEIGHIVNLDDRNGLEYNYDYIDEYYAEMFAIRMARSFRVIPPECLQQYITSAKEYVFSHLVKDLEKDYIRIEEVRKDIMKWLGLKKSDLLANIVN